MYNPPQLLNIKQLAEKLGAPTVTVRYWLRVGRCPVPHIDGTKPQKFRLADVEAFLAARDGDE